jgi:hypothetical protein
MRANTSWTSARRPVEPPRRPAACVLCWQMHPTCMTFARLVAGGGSWRTQAPNIVLFGLERACLRVSKWVCWRVCCLVCSGGWFSNAFSSMYRGHMKRCIGGCGASVGHIVFEPRSLIAVALRRCRVCEMLHYRVRNTQPNPIVVERLCLLCGCRSTIGNAVQDRRAV